MRKYLRAMEVSILISFSVLLVSSPSNKVVPRMTKCDLEGELRGSYLGCWLARNSTQVILPLYTTLTNSRKRLEGRWTKTFEKDKDTKCKFYSKPPVYSQIKISQGNQCQQKIETFSKMVLPFATSLVVVVNEILSNLSLIYSWTATVYGSS